MGDWFVRTHWFECDDEAIARRVFARLEEVSERIAASDEDGGATAIYFGYLGPRLIAAETSQKWGEDGSLESSIVEDISGVRCAHTEEGRRLKNRGISFLKNPRLAFWSSDSDVMRRLAPLGESVALPSGALVIDVGNIPLQQKEITKLVGRAMKLAGATKLQSLLAPLVVIALTDDHGPVVLFQNDIDDRWIYRIAPLQSRWAGNGTMPWVDALVATPKIELPKLERWHRGGETFATTDTIAAISKAIHDRDPIERQTAWDDARRLGRVEFAEEALAVVEDDPSVRAAASRARLFLTGGDPGKKDRRADILNQEAATFRALHTEATDTELLRAALASSKDDEREIGLTHFVADPPLEEQLDLIERAAIEDTTPWFRDAAARALCHSPERASRFATHLARQIHEDKEGLRKNKWTLRTLILLRACALPHLVPLLALPEDDALLALVAMSLAEPKGTASMDAAKQAFSSSDPRKIFCEAWALARGAEGDDLKAIATTDALPALPVAAACCLELIEQLPASAPKLHAFADAAACAAHTILYASYWMVDLGRPSLDIPVALLAKRRWLASKSEQGGLERQCQETEKELLSRLMDWGGASDFLAAGITFWCSSAIAEALDLNPTHAALASLGALHIAVLAANQNPSWRPPSAERVDKWMADAAGRAWTAREDALRAQGAARLEALKKKRIARFFENPDGDDRGLKMALAWILEDAAKVESATFKQTLRMLEEHPLLVTSSIVPELFSIACALGERQERELALPFYERILAIPVPVSGWARTSWLRAANNAIVAAQGAGDLKTARAFCELAAPVASENPYLFHSAACIYALLGEKEKALEQVSLAVKHKYEHLDLVRRDQDLASLWELPEFQKLFARR